MEFDTEDQVLFSCLFGKWAGGGGGATPKIIINPLKSMKIQEISGTLEQLALAWHNIFLSAPHRREQTLYFWS